MRFVVVGAGAIGGFLGAHLASSGQDVTLVARGPHLAAMRAHGVRVRAAAGDFTARPACTDDLGLVGSADVVFLTVKAHGLTPIAPALGAALGPETSVVTMQNGIPWWYFERHGGPLEGTRLEAVDPGGVIADSIQPHHVVGSVVYPATSLVEPGVIEHVEGTRFSIGELDGSRSERCRAISTALTKAGLKCPVRTRIRSEIWLKLLGNVAFNPMSALTRSTLAAMAAMPETRAVARAAMEEADTVARALGVELQLTVDQRLAGAAAVGEHKTSMLQDLESGRPLELQALVGSVVELGHLVDMPLPHLETLYACATLLDQTARGAS